MPQSDAIRIGIGYDVHGFAPSDAGRPLIIGGITIPKDRGLAGHSDADVLLHAIADALLGAAALGDIGQHFPPGDPQYLGISSLVLLTRVAEMVASAGFRVSNVDSALVAEKPKLAPHMPLMRRRIGEALGLAIDRVSIKATTSEGLGFAGRGEGIAAWAVALLEETSTRGEVARGLG